MEQPKLDFLNQRRILSVSQLVHELRIQLETEFRDLWVQGEISNFKEYGTGHCYFTLKDKDAQISAVCFRLQAQMLRFRPEDGMDVIARGKVSVYPQRGQLQIIVETMEPLGQGALQLAFEQLKAKLSREGLFDPSHKKSLPVLPTRVGVVTSPSGAAIQDILRVLERRNENLNVLLSPARVQGAGAAAEIARAIQILDDLEDVDVIIVGRGGGSLEDLWAFNEEVVARAIFRARKPVISAVGHEIDFTIADFVADIRAATPSAAAELVSKGREELQRLVFDLRGRSVQAVRLFLSRKRSSLQALASNRAFVDAESRLRMLAQRLDELTSRLSRSAQNLCEPMRQRIRSAEKEVVLRIRIMLEQMGNELKSRRRQLQAISPLAVLERGYAIVTTGEDAVVTAPDQVAQGERVNIRVSEGRFRARKE